MKKIALVMMLILLLSSVSAETPFKVTATVPPFVRPGDRNVTVQVAVKLESGEYQDVEVELILPRFFSFSKEGSGTSRLGDMSTKDIMKSPFQVALFQLDISRDAVYGDYTVQVYISTRSGTFMDSFIIHVVGETLLDITDVFTSQDPIEPGTSFDLNITVKNIGSNAIKWMKVILNPSAAQDVSTQLTAQQLAQVSQAASVTGTSSVIIPISSDLERIFRSISPGKSVVASYSLSVESDAESRNYAMTVTLVYEDETGMVLTESRTIGIRIKGTPNLELQGIEADPSFPYQGEEVIISVTLENTGTAEARSVKVNVRSSLGEYTSFIGTMKRNENNAAVFKILIPKTEQKLLDNLVNNLLNRMETYQYSLTIQVFYEDSEGNASGFVESWDFSARTKRDRTVFYILGGIVLLIIIAVWRIQSRRHLKVLEEE